MKNKLYFIIITILTVLVIGVVGVRVWRERPKQGLQSVTGHTGNYLRPTNTPLHVKDTDTIAFIYEHSKLEPIK